MFEGKAHKYGCIKKNDTINGIEVSFVEKNWSY